MKLISTLIFLLCVTFAFAECYDNHFDECRIERQNGKYGIVIDKQLAIPFVLFIKITDDTVFPALSDFEKAIVLRYDFVVLVRYGQLFVDHDTVFPVLPFDPALVEMVVVAFCKCKSYTQ